MIMVRMTIYEDDDDYGDDGGGFYVEQGRKKKFIDKKESSTFHVVHRSQQDKANEGEGEASEFVLIPSGVSYDIVSPIFIAYRTCFIRRFCVF